MAEPFTPDIAGAPACDLNEFDPDSYVRAPMTPKIEWFTTPPEWMTPGYGASVALCGEETGRFAMYVAEFDKPFQTPYILPNGQVLTHHPKGAVLFEKAWSNPLVVKAGDDTQVIYTGLFGFEHSPDDDFDSFETLAASTLDFHTEVRSDALGDVRQNPLAAVAYAAWGEDEVGPYMIGALAPNVRYRDAAILFSSQVSTELLFDGLNFHALPAAAVPIGNADRSRIAAATSSSGPQQYSMRVLAAATMVDETEDTTTTSCSCGEQPVEEEEEPMADVDLSAIETQLGSMASAFQEALEGMNQRIDAITPEPEPEPEAWEAPIEELATNMKSQIETFTTRLDEVAASVTELSDTLEKVVDTFFELNNDSKDDAPDLDLSDVDTSADDDADADATDSDDDATDSDDGGDSIDGDADGAADDGGDDASSEDATE